MHPALLLLPLVFGVPHRPPAPVYSGRARALDVHVPRIDAEIRIDGRLDEPAWESAAILTGFSRYAPTDGVAADDSTEVMVWYTSSAIHFGIRAFAEPGSVHATLADRDRIYGDDYIGIFLCTFNDGRQATVFAANPLGVQGDGIVVESGQSGGIGREPTDISPDFVFQSKGRLTDFGYEVEIRIPFKSLKYQSSMAQNWGINVIRKAQSRGYEYSWAPALRASASYLAQAGHLVGLSDLRRGLVLDVNPVVTTHANGVEGPTGYDFDTERPRLGANIRWGVTNNLTLNGTVHPDFAEVESDAGQFTFDPRQSLYFPEKRPFFLEGSEQFTAPGGLIYTRRILSPLVATKLAGKVAGTSIAYLAAVDDTLGSVTGHDHPIFNILRLTRDVGASSRAGLLLTDRADGDYGNQVAAGDVRLVFRRIYSAQLQGAMSRTTRPGVSATTAPMWSGTFARASRTFNARYAISGIDPDFRASAGFIGRSAIAHASAVHNYTVYGRKGALIESATATSLLDDTWQYDRFVRGRDAIEKKAHIATDVLLRGGWHAGGTIMFETFGFDDALYANYAIERHQGGVIDTIPFTGTPRLPNRDYMLTLDTPQFRHFSFSGMYLWGRDENFFEWAPSDIGYLTLFANWRPTDRFRMEGSYIYQFYRRPSDGSTVGSGRIPRLKLEYQVTRSIFVRAVGQYTAQFQDDLRDNSRTDDPLLVRANDGTYVRATGGSSNVFQADALFSYLPTPGTVIYAGYGNTSTEPGAMRFADLRRERDGFFVKMSYLFRL